MESAPTVNQYRFEGWDLPTKYGWMHSGAGVQAATEVQDVVRRMADRLTASGDLVRDLLPGAEWMGAAAQAAGQAMQRGAGQITQTAGDVATTERCVTELGESFQTAQHRVPSPNEIPSGLGDAFLFGAAEGFTVFSPFDVQSPLHEAMEQRRELDRQANQALTDHMTTSRDRVEAMPVVTAPAPMTVAMQSAGTSGVGGVGQPPGGTSVPTGMGGAPLLPGPPVSTGPAQTISPGSGSFRLRPTGSAITGVTAAEPGLGGAAFGPHPGGPAGAGRVGVGSAGFGARSGLGGEGMSGRGAPGLGGLAGGPAGGVALAGRGGGTGGIGAGGARSPGVGSFLQPAVGDRGSDDDTEHKDRYAQHADHIVGELPLVAPAVIGETPEEEELRLHRAQDGR